MLFTGAGEGGGPSSQDIVREEMLKDGVKMSRGWKLEERMRRLREGEGMTPLEAVKGQVRRAIGPREEGSSGVLSALAPGQRRGRDKGVEGVFKGGQMWPV